VGEAQAAAKSLKRPSRTAMRDRRTPAGPVSAALRTGRNPKISVMAIKVTISQAMKVTKRSTWTGGFERERPFV
jgi:hypothetical protein